MSEKKISARTCPFCDGIPTIPISELEAVVEELTGYEDDAEVKSQALLGEYDAGRYLAYGKSILLIQNLINEHKGGRG